MGLERLLPCGPPILQSSRRCDGRAQSSSYSIDGMVEKLA
jgi:hypothetical protein